MSADAMLQVSALVPEALRDAAPAASRFATTDTFDVLRLLDAPEQVQVEVPHVELEAVWWRGSRLDIPIWYD